MSQIASSKYSQEIIFMGIKSTFDAEKQGDNLIVGIKTPFGNNCHTVAKKECIHQVKQLLSWLENE